MSLIWREALRTSCTISTTDHKVRKPWNILEESLLLYIITKTGRPEWCPSIVGTKLRRTIQTDIEIYRIFIKIRITCTEHPTDRATCILASRHLIIVFLTEEQVIHIIIWETSHISSIRISTVLENTHAGIGSDVMVLYLLIPTGSQIHAPIYSLILCTAIITFQCRISNSIKSSMLCRTEHVTMSHTLRE